MTRTPARLDIEAGPSPAEIVRMMNKLRGNAFVSLHAAETAMQDLETPDELVSVKRTRERCIAAMKRARTHYHVLARFARIPDTEFMRRYAVVLAKLNATGKDSSNHG